MSNDERQKIREALRRARDEVRTSREELQASQEELQRVQESFAPMQKEIDRLRARSEQLELKVREKTESEERWRNTAKVAERDLSQMLGTITELRRDNGAMGLKILTLQSRIQKLERDRATAGAGGSGAFSGSSGSSGSHAAAGGWTFVAGFPAAPHVPSVPLPPGVTLKDVLKLVHPDRWATDPELEKIASALTRTVLDQRRKEG